MDRPKLRKVERIQHRRGAEEMVIVRDPLGLGEPFALDAEFAPLLDLLDGSRTIAQIRQSLLMTQSLDITTDEIADFVEQLRSGALLDDDTFIERWADAHQDFLDAPTRAPTLAGLVYPANADELSALLEAAVPRDPTPARTDPETNLRGVVVPHGPFDRVGALLDETLRHLPPPDAIEAIVILGTDHGPGLLPYAVTDKSYATPLGALPVATDLIAALGRRVDWIRREEIRHRDALSIELAAVLLLHLWGDRCPPVVPVLCGATAVGVQSQEESRLQFELSLGALCEDRNILWWVSAELSHAGPAYGRPEVTDEHRIGLQARDSELLAATRRGDEETLETLLEREHPQGPASGGPALAAATRMLPTGYRGELVRQTSYPAAGDVPGVVGVGGLRLYDPV